MFKLTLSFKGKILKVHHLTEGDTVIGRDPDCQLHIDSLAIDPHHARIHLHGNELKLFNLSATAGTLVNQKPVSEQALQDGDLIQIGKHTLNVTLDETTLSTAVDVVPEPPATNVPSRIGWLQVLNGPHLGRAFPIEPHEHRIGKPGTPSALISVTDGRYHIAPLADAACNVDGQPLDNTGRTLSDGAIIECGELRLQFFMDQAVSIPAAHKPPPSAATLRHFSRIPFDAQAYLRNDAMVWQCQLIDVSLKGALITRPGDWPGAKGDIYQLELLLDDEQTAIHMTVSVAHAGPDRIGLQCRHIDIDSITHLRRLVELNLGEPELLERELATLG